MAGVLQLIRQLTFLNGTEREGVTVNVLGGKGGGKRFRGSGVPGGFRGSRRGKKTPRGKKKPFKPGGKKGTPPNPQTGGKGGGSGKGVSLTGPPFPVPPFFGPP